MQLYCDQERLEVAVTDRETAIRYRVGAQVAQPGSVVLPARTISDLVALLDAQQVNAVHSSAGAPRPTSGAGVPGSSLLCPCLPVSPWPGWRPMHCATAPAA